MQQICQYFPTKVMAVLQICLTMNLLGSNVNLIDIQVMVMTKFVDFRWQPSREGKEECLACESVPPPPPQLGGYVTETNLPELLRFDLHHSLQPTVPSYGLQYILGETVMWLKGKIQWGLMSLLWWTKVLLKLIKHWFKPRTLIVSRSCLRLSVSLNQSTQRRP